jgi:adenylate cyclase class 2
MYEVEVKAYLKDRKGILEKLLNLGCVFSEELHQIDHIFIPENIDFPPPFDVPVLRIRKQNKKHIFTMKISQSNRQDCIEKELEILDGDKMLEIVKFLKYKQVPVVDKKRIKTNLNEIEICIDEVLGLGEFIEVEKIVNNENAEDRKEIQLGLINFLEELGVNKEDHLLGSKYDIMLFEKKT